MATKTSAPRAAKTQRSPRISNRDRILAAGIKLFAEHGPDATSVSMISEASGLNRRMLYHYFGSKEGLYEEVLKAMYDRMNSVDVDLAHMLLPAEELLKKIIQGYYRFLNENPEFVRILSWENLRHGRTAKAIDVAAVKAPLIKALGVSLQMGARDGRFRSDVDENQLLISCMALSFFFFSNQYTLSMLLGKDIHAPRLLEQRVNHVTQLILEGILIKQPTPA
ncbi:MAG TPA: TetR/AcrR family transcriptional regulator [Candidatus Sumerlaeota bacterium]|nr:MAG: HTH-type transcriptional repressor NicS [candidate division BRC1 bacterium ADurb.BinA292]HOE95127.1 TetR/AcrR family transcriptional regulator [Candidatus Sumerlaeota bacterium]HOR26575.1 TetR/AcrR family transcriptional regulator [Candidatus Sumerlaeota bacterium]HPK01236.1 TetR/AcrR family transcriptional regulator [Candidatus Sumerlaeota bacterium]